MPEKNQQFNDLADSYNKCRPSYPDRIFRLIKEWVEKASLTSKSIIDVGSGTGISTGLLNKHFGDSYNITGVEPGLGMRTQAERNFIKHSHVSFVDAAAEYLPFDDNSACLITVAQAAHWFDRQKFYAEVTRILESGGVLAIMENNRRWDEDEFQGAFEDFLEKYSPKYTRYYRANDYLNELTGFSGFKNTEKIIEPWDRTMTIPEFIGLCLSTIYIKNIVKKYGKNKTLELLNQFISSFHKSDDTIIVPYRTELHIARNKS